MAGPENARPHESRCARIANDCGNRAGGPAYAGNPRPAVIVQDDSFDATGSLTICAFTTDPTEAPLLRIAVEPSEGTGLWERCSPMVDNLTTVPKRKFGEWMGRLGDEDTVKLNRAMMVFLGLAGSSK